MSNIGRPRKYTDADITTIQQLHNIYGWGCLRISRKLNIPRNSVTVLMRRYRDERPCPPANSSSIEQLAMNTLETQIQNRLTSFSHDSVPNKGENTDDVYMEAMIEYTSIVDMHNFLINLIAEINKVGDNERIRGMIFALNNLANYYHQIDCADPTKDSNKI